MMLLQMEHSVDSWKPAAAAAFGGGGNEPSPQILLFTAERRSSNPLEGLLRSAERRIAWESERWGGVAIDVRSALETAKVLAESARDAGETRLLCVALGLFHAHRGAWSEARSSLRDALATRPDPEEAALCHWLIGRVALASAPPEEAIRRCAAALAKLRRSSTLDLGIRVRFLAADAYLRRGDAYRSRHALDRAMEMQELHPDPELLADLHLCAADIHAEAGRWDAADLSCKNALALIQSTDRSGGIAAIERRRAGHALARYDLVRGRERLDAAISVLGPEEELERGRIRKLDARLSLEEGHEEAAWEAMRGAERSFRRMNAFLDLADLLVMRAEAVATHSVDGAMRWAAREGLFDARALYRNLGRARDVTACEMLMESLRSVRSETRMPSGAGTSRARPPRVPRTRRLTQLGFLTSEPSILRAFEPLESLAKTTIPVLILGESGTGKEVLARALHRAAGGRGAFIAVNCGALPSELQESELFGHVRGAFTGAVADRIGLFEAADGGTLLLDEVGEMTPRAQVKLLRVLELGEVRRVGETKTRKIQVRVLAATNADLVANIRSGQFRRDLYYRLCGLKVELPPLRDRLGDVPLLAAHFIRQFKEADGGAAPPHLSCEALDILLQHHWPGNVRELRFCIEKAFALTSALERDRIEPDCIDIELVEAARAGHAAEEAAARTEESLQPSEGLDRYLENLERRFILRALEEHRWNRTHAARSLGGMSRTTLIGKMKRLGLFPEKGEEEEEEVREA